MKRHLVVLLVMGMAMGVVAEESIGPQLGSGFPINPVNYASITISGAPAGAVVNSVKVRIAGSAPYAEYCTFQLRDSSGTVAYTFPTWDDLFSFDHEVENITDFPGRPVNQTWELWGQGSNLTGERVDQWWLTVYYDEPLNPGVRIFGPSRVEVNDMVTLTAALTDMTGPYSYEWHLDGSSIIGATDAQYIIPAAQYSDAGTYTVSVVDGSMTTYDSPDFVLQVLAEGSLPATSLSMISILMLLVIAVGVLCISRRREGSPTVTD
jgi:hypothetical protein